MTLPAITEYASDIPIAEKFSTVKKVVTPVLQMQIDKPIYVRFLTECYIGEKIDGAPDAPTLVLVLNMETMDECIVVVSHIVRESLHDQYADGAYVGKYFKITKLAKRTGKKYNDYRMVEVQPIVTRGE